MKSLFLSLLAIESSSADSFGQTIINSVPYTISTPGTYVVGSNLVYPTANSTAISIVVSEVTLDLAGHYILNPGTYNGTVAISVHDAANVTIQNGTILNFPVGVEFFYTGKTDINSGNIVQNLRLANPLIGILLNGVGYSKVTNNQITNSYGIGGSGISIKKGPGNVASENIIVGFDWGIFSSGGYNYLVENTISDCSFGLWMAPGDKYRFNTTFNCSNFTGGTALGAENE
jgi:Periplasmic copper-binding protein (NosD)